ncbi:hypothetical protein DKX38_020310 [Salix brachista]|uniref:Uncharacterized protein n=1 Tax=Salix brachista TaxID=2182728 RepID=A0A5N5KIP4_9ROSI|nr:hypothetical protein DKX38_020310 [Salix brachista]
MINTNNTGRGTQGYGTEKEEEGTSKKETRVKQFRVGVQPTRRAYTGRFGSPPFLREKARTQLEPTPITGSFYLRSNSGSASPNLKL